MTKLNRHVASVLMYIWLSSIWLISTLPSKSLPKLDILKFDKLSHLTVYLVLSILAFINHRHGFFGRMRRWDVLFLFCTTAALEEAHQVFVSNRSVSVLDLAANLIGIFMGYFIVINISHHYDRIKATKPVSK